MAATFAERVTAKTTDVRIGRALLSIVAAPFYAIGFLLGLVLVVIVWCWAAVTIGISDGRRVRSEDPVTNGAS